MTSDYEPLKKAARFILFVSALGFFAYYVVRNWEEVKTVAGEIEPLILIVALLLVIASLFCKALINLQLLKRLLHTPLDGLTIFHSYAKSQMVKYVPGRIWGILFQASTLENNVRKTDVWVVGVLEALIIHSFSLVVLMGTILFIDTLAPAIKATVLTGGFLAIAIVYFNFGRILRLAGFSEETLRKYTALIDTPLVLQVALVVVLDWVFYIGMWAVLAHGQLSLFESFVTAVNYATASIVGWLVFVLPNGLVVREALFIAFGKILGDSMALLVMYSLVARLLYLLGDLLLYLLTILVKTVYERPKGTLGQSG